MLYGYFFTNKQKVFNVFFSKNFANPLPKNSDRLHFIIFKATLDKNKN